MTKNNLSNFKEKFSSPISTNVAVIGVGYVGLPIAYNLAISVLCCLKRTKHNVTALILINLE